MSHAEVNAKTLAREATQSGNGESLRVLSKSDDYRVGVGVRLAEASQTIFFLEVLVYLCPQAKGIQLARLKAKLRLVEELSARGYSLNCEDGGCISCEAVLSSRKLASEATSVMSLVQAILEGTDTS